MQKITSNSLKDGMLMQEENLDTVDQGQRTGPSEEKECSQSGFSFSNSSSRCTG
jgi:hypothetical protein